MPFAHLMYTTPAPLSGSGREATTEPLRQELANSLGTLIAMRLRKQADLVALRVEPVPELQWTIGGASLRGSPRTGAHLQVQVTAGTNTADEMEAFIAEAFALLERSLGPLHPASYLVVQELPATAWGFGGRTQESRRLERAGR